MSKAILINSNLIRVEEIKQILQNDCDELGVIIHSYDRSHLEVSFKDKNEKSAFMRAVQDSINEIDMGTNFVSMNSGVVKTSK